VYPIGDSRVEWSPGCGHFTFTGITRDQWLARDPIEHEGDGRFASARPALRCAPRAARVPLSPREARLGGPETGESPGRRDGLRVSLSEC
jgi:hypothetical protein